MAWGGTIKPDDVQTILWTAPPTATKAATATARKTRAANERDDRPRADVQRRPVQQELRPRRLHQPQVSYFRSLTAANHNRRTLPRRATVPKHPRFRALRRVPARLRRSSSSTVRSPTLVRWSKDPHRQGTGPSGRTTANRRITAVGRRPYNLRRSSAKTARRRKSPKTCCWIVRLRRFVTLTEVTRPPERHLTPNAASTDR